MKRGFQRVKIDGAILRDRRCADARQEVQARHRRRRRPHRRCGRTSRRGSSESFETALELADGIAIAEYADEKDEKGAPKRITFSAEIRLSGVGLHDPRDRAAPVLLQQSVRRLSALRRPRLRADRRRRAHRAGSEADACAKAPSRPGRDRARPITCRRSKRSRGISNSASTCASSLLPKEMQDDHPLRLRQGERALFL